MLLSALADRVSGEAGLVGDDVDITDVTHDSRLVKPGDLFVAVRGYETDGHRYLDDAVESGAAAVAVEQAADIKTPQLVVADTRAALGPLAAAVHGEPSRKISVIGVTGTNGKTTVTHLIEGIVDAAGLKPGVIGTVGARIAGVSIPVPRTTPEASDLQRLLDQMVGAGVDVAAIEVSSHALALNRVDGTWFAVGAFTNLMRDHLDFHGDMDTYFATKRELFSSARVERAVVAVDDEAGRSIAGASAVPVTTTAVDHDAQVTAVDIATTMDGSAFTIVTPEGSYAASIPLPGAFNVKNALVAAAIAREIGIDEQAIVAGLGGVGAIPGRFESVVAGQPFAVVVDYAHTPDAVKAVVASARQITNGRVITVIGAGGDRDREKRPAMGAAAAAADLAVITSDNPRSEDPQAIIADMIAGVPKGADVITEPDRRTAIRSALNSAGEADLVLILGKGHEQGQELGDTTLPFDDRVVAAEELRSIRGDGP